MGKQCDFHMLLAPCLISCKKHLKQLHTQTLDFAQSWNPHFSRNPTLAEWGLNSAREAKRRVAPPASGAVSVWFTAGPIALPLEPDRTSSLKTAAEAWLPLISESPGQTSSPLELTAKNLSCLLNVAASSGKLTADAGVNAVGPLYPGTRSSLCTIASDVSARSRAWWRTLYDIHYPSSNPIWSCRKWVAAKLVYNNFTSSTAQGGGGSFKNRKPIGEVGCCESGMAERSHWWTERCLRSPLFLSLSLTIYLPIYLSIYLSIYVSIYRCIYLSISLSLFHLATYLST